MKYLTSRKSLKEFRSASIELYEALNGAVERSYGYRVENVFEASAMNNRISNSYRVVKPEILTDVDGRFVYSEFVKSGIITSGVSMVYEDDERNVSFFYIDTIQAMSDENGNLVWVPCKARVEVEGVNLLTEDVYASFIKGEHLSFTELSEDRDLKAGSEFFNLG